METREQEQMSSDSSEERTGPDEGGGAVPPSPEAVDADGAVAADAAMPTLPPRVEPTPTPRLDRPPEVDERLVSLDQIDEDDTSWCEDARAAIRSGNVRGASFAFMVAPDGDTWDRSGGEWLRVLTDVDLLECSPTPLPAYQ